MCMAGKKHHTLERIVRVPKSRAEVFDFFSKAENLNQLTPPELHFKILTPTPIDMYVGSLIDYRIRLKGLPMRWRTEITRWDPPFCFVDFQLRGPYVLWDHLHEFYDEGDHTVIYDRVNYIPRGGPLAGIAHALFVKSELKKIFDYRTAAILNIFGGVELDRLPERQVEEIAV